MAGTCTRGRGSSALIDEITEYLQLGPADPSSDQGGGGGQLGEVLLPYSGSPSARRAVEAAIRLAAVMGNEVRVLHVREYDRVRGSCFYLESIAEAQAMADDAVDRLRRAGVHARATVCRAPRSELAHAIVGEAEDAHVAMIVLGARFRQGPAGVLQRNLAKGVLRRARCPVLVVPADRSGKPPPGVLPLEGRARAVLPHRRRPAA